MDFVIADDIGFISDKAFKEINEELARKKKPALIHNYKPLDNGTRMLSLGAVGEKLVRWYFTQIGKKIIEAFDPLDKNKDFAFENGETAEIKTQSPYYNLQSFTVKDNQRTKLTKVDNVYFLETPRHKGTTYAEWNYAKRQTWVKKGGSSASDFESTLYSWKNEPGLNIAGLIFEKDVMDRITNKMRKMLFIPMKSLTKEFNITEPKHLILLDKYSTNPIGLT